jgi:hypothetical protein
VSVSVCWFCHVEYDGVARFLILWHFLRIHEVTFHMLTHKEWVERGFPAEDIFP